MSESIVSMATPNYHRWIYTFYHGIRKYNSDIHIRINLINYLPHDIDLLRQEFPDVEFCSFEGDFGIHKEKGHERYKVTFLKGRFMNKALDRFDRALWIDITALIRVNLERVFESLKQKDLVLNRRDFENDKGKAVYAAEIFGMSNKRASIVYSMNCDRRKNLWFSDQISLCALNSFSREYLEFGDFSNFDYSPEASSWSDRVPEHDKTDLKKDYAFNKYIEDLGSTEHYKEWSGEDKPKIMIFTDDEKWCFYNQAIQIIQELKSEFNFTLITNAKKQAREVRNWEGDLIYARCSATRANKLLRIKPSYRSKTIVSLTSGGELADSRVEAHKKDGKGMYGVITQNQQTYDLLKDEFKVWKVPNGVDLERFKPIERNPEERLVIGFAGRHYNEGADKQKGFTDFFLKPCHELGLKTMYADSKSAFIPHNKMQEFYDKIDILVQVSDSEGCSNTITEAMASGIPCVISKVGYHGEVCSDEVSFVNRDISEVKEALVSLYDNKTYQEISKKARKFAEKHSKEWQCEKYKEIFLEAINKPKDL